MNCWEPSCRQSAAKPGREAGRFNDYPLWSRPKRAEARSSMIECQTCGIEKSEAEYYRSLEMQPNGKRLDRQRKHCKDCWKDIQRYRKYAVCRGHYEVMIARQKERGRLDAVQVLRAAAY